MKMMYAGLSSNPEAIAENFLFNCIKNKCQKKFLVPINDLSDVMLFVSLPGPLTVFSFDIIGCDATGMPVDEVSISCNYSIGSDGNGNYFGIFTGFTTMSDLKTFYIKLTATYSGSDYIYFTQQYEVSSCEQLMLLEACYPLPESEIATIALYDCNGIYYGPAVGGIGNPDLKYVHKAYARQGVIYESANKMSFTMFNSTKGYKNQFTRQWNFECESLPAFYKDVLAGIFNRGTVSFNNVEYTLAESQELAPLDSSNQLWPIDIKLQSICNNYFGCGVEDCNIPAMPCNNFTGGSYSGGNITLTGSTLLQGDTIVWELYNSEDELIQQGTAAINPFAIVPVDVETECFLLRFKKICLCDATNEFDEFNFGNCGSEECTCAPVLGVITFETIE